MPVAPLIPLLIQYSLQYGVPAVIKLIETLQKPEVTLDDIKAAFAASKTPYGLTAELVNTPPPPVTPEVIELGRIEPAPLPNPPEAAAQVLPGTVILTKLRAKAPPTLCDKDGNCWAFDMTLVGRKVLTGANEEWTLPSGKKFWVAAHIIVDL